MSGVSFGNTLTRNQVHAILCKNILTTNSVILNLTDSIYTMNTSFNCSQKLPGNFLDIPYFPLFGGPFPIY